MGRANAAAKAALIVEMALILAVASILVMASIPVMVGEARSMVLVIAEGAYRSRMKAGGREGLHYFQMRAGGQEGLCPCQMRVDGQKGLASDYQMTACGRQMAANPWMVDHQKRAAAAG